MQNSHEVDISQSTPTYLHLIQHKNIIVNSFLYHIIWLLPKLFYSPQHNSQGWPTSHLNLCTQMSLDVYKSPTSLLDVGENHYNNNDCYLSCAFEITKIVSSLLSTSLKSSKFHYGGIKNFKGWKNGFYLLFQLLKSPNLTCLLTIS